MRIIKPTIGGHGTPFTFEDERWEINEKNTGNVS